MRLMTMLFPLFLHGLISLFYYLFSEDLAGLAGGIHPAFSLLLLVLCCGTVPFLLYHTSLYLLSLLELTKKSWKMARKLVMVLTFIFLFGGFYFIVFLNGDNWQAGLTRAINELFLYGSLALLILAVIASVFIKGIKNREKKTLLRGIVISFYPMVAFFVIDLLFMMDSPYKLVNISYFIFFILVYLYTARHHVYQYEPESPALPELNDRFYSDLDISGREKELIPLLVEGKSNKEISEILFISPNTVKTHIRNIYRKAGVSNRIQLLYKLGNHPEG